MKEVQGRTFDEAGQPGNAVHRPQLGGDHAIRVVGIGGPRRASQCRWAHCRARGCACLAGSKRARRSAIVTRGRCRRMMIPSSIAMTSTASPTRSRAASSADADSRTAALFPHLSIHVWRSQQEATNERAGTLRR